MNQKQRAEIRFKYLTDPIFNAKHHRMADTVSENKLDHWHITLEMSLYGRAFVWVSPLGRCSLINEDDLDFKHPGGKCQVFFKMPDGEMREIPGHSLIELTMVGNTDQKKMSNGLVEMRKLIDFQRERRGF